MKAVFSAAIDIQTFCQSKQYRFCFIGGLAVARWGEPRFTEDADLTLMTGWGEEAPYIDSLLASFESRIEDAITCSAEDLIVHKAFAGRDQDWADILGILRRQGVALNRELIFAELTPLAELKDDGEVLCRLEKMLERAG